MNEIITLKSGKQIVITPEKKKALIKAFKNKFNSMDAMEREIENESCCMDYSKL